jgi:hypothetical protein
MKALFEKSYGLKLADIPKHTRKTKFGGHVAGKKYFCGYWRRVYEVLEVKEVSDWRQWVAVCRWEDGEVNAHSTRLIPGKDFEVVEEKALSVV